MFLLPTLLFFFFFFNDTATTEIYTLSLHDALPIYRRRGELARQGHRGRLARAAARGARPPGDDPRSEEHTSELQSPCNLVCRLLLEKKKKRHNKMMYEMQSMIMLNVQMRAVACRWR